MYWHYVANTSFTCIYILKAYRSMCVYTTQTKCCAVLGSWSKNSGDVKRNKMGMWRIISRNAQLMHGMAASFIWSSTYPSWFEVSYMCETQSSIRHRLRPHLRNSSEDSRMVNPEMAQRSKLKKRSEPPNKSHDRRDRVGLDWCPSNNIWVGDASTSIISHRDVEQNNHKTESQLGSNVYRGKSWQNHDECSNRYLTRSQTCRFETLIPRSMRNIW